MWSLRCRLGSWRDGLGRLSGLPAWPEVEDLGQIGLADRTVVVHIEPDESGHRPLEFGGADQAVVVGIHRPQPGDDHRAVDPAAERPDRFVLGDHAVMVGVEPGENGLRALELILADLAVLVRVHRLVGPGLLLERHQADEGQVAGRLGLGDGAVVIGVDVSEDLLRPLELGPADLAVLVGVHRLEWTGVRHRRR